MFVPGLGDGVDGSLKFKEFIVLSGTEFDDGMVMNGAFLLFPEMCTSTLDQPNAPDPA